MEARFHVQHLWQPSCRAGMNLGRAQYPLQFTHNNAHYHYDASPSDLD